MGLLLDSRGLVVWRRTLGGPGPSADSLVSDPGVLSELYWPMREGRASVIMDECGSAFSAPSRSATTAGSPWPQADPVCVPC